jgi:hypothetical protein
MWPKFTTRTPTRPSTQLVVSSHMSASILTHIPHKHLAAPRFISAPAPCMSSWLNTVSHTSDCNGSWRQSARCRDGHDVRHWDRRQPGRPATFNPAPVASSALPNKGPIHERVYGSAPAVGMCGPRTYARPVCGRDRDPAEPSLQRRCHAVAGVAWT